MATTTTTASRVTDSPPSPRIDGWTPTHATRARAAATWTHSWALTDALVFQKHGAASGVVKVCLVVVASLASYFFHVTLPRTCSSSRLSAATSRPPPR